MVTVVGILSFLAFLMVAMVVYYIYITFLRDRRSSQVRKAKEWGKSAIITDNINRVQANVVSIKKVGNHPCRILLH